MIVFHLLENNKLTPILGLKVARQNVAKGTPYLGTVSMHVPMTFIVLHFEPMSSVEFKPYILFEIVACLYAWSAHLVHWASGHHGQI